MKSGLVICCISILAILMAPSISLAFSESGYIVDDLITLQEGQIDIGLVALRLAKEVYPEIDIAEYSKKIDGIVVGVRALTRYSTDPDFRIRALNTYLYKHYKLEYDLSDPDAQKLENHFITGILDTKKGSCITMPLLYLAVAQRLGYPVYPVAAPSHLFLRYVDPKLKLQNIEATTGGGYVPDDEYQHVLKVSDKGIESGAYLNTMTYREFLGDLIAENGIYWARQGDVVRGIIYLDRALKLNPKSADIHYTLGELYRELAKTAVAPFDRQHSRVSKEYFQESVDLGVVRLSNKNYVAEQEKAQAAYRQAKGEIK